MVTYTDFSRKINTLTFTIQLSVSATEHAQLEGPIMLFYRTHTMLRTTVLYTSIIISCWKLLSVYKMTTVYVINENA